MRIRSQNRLYLLSFILTILFFVVLFQNDNQFAPESKKLEIENKSGIKQSDSWSNFTYIHITDSNWSVAANYDWCKGNGTWGNPYVIENLTINATTSPTGSGIYIENSTNVYFIIRNVTVINSGSTVNDGGIKLENSSNGTLIINNCSYNGRNGILLKNSNNNSVLENTLESNVMNGIYLENADDNIIVNNSMFKNSDHGIHVYSSSDRNNISSNNITDNMDNGVYINGNSNDNLIQNNTIANIVTTWQDRGISMDTSNNNIIRENIIKNNMLYGIFVQNSQNTQIYNNSILNDGPIYQDDGIIIQSNSVDTLIENNTLKDHTDSGIKIRTFSYNTSIINNDLINNRMVLDTADICLLSGNNLSGAGLYLAGTLDQLASHTVYSNNTVNNKVLYYYSSEIGLDNSNFTNAGQILIVNCSNVNISFFNLSNTEIGVGLYYTNNSIVAHNTMNSIEYGIFLFQSVEVNILNNSLDYGGAGINTGIYLTDYCRNNTIENNTVIDYYYSIYLNNYCTNNSISNNTIKLSTQGIRLRNYCDYNNITNNQNFENTQYPIHFYISSNNNVSNNLINQIFDDGIYLEYFSSYNQIINNSISNAQVNGIAIDDNSQYNDIINNTAVYSTEQGLILWDNSNNNNIIGNNFSYNSDSGIQIGELIAEGYNNNITNNIISNNDRGIYLYYAGGTNIFNNTISNNQVMQGITIASSGGPATIINNNVSFSLTGIGIYDDSNLIQDNNVFNCTSGIRISGGDNNNVTENIVSNCSGEGIIVAGGANSANNLIISNIIQNNTLGLNIVSSIFTDTNYVYLNQFLSNNLHAQDNCGAFDNFWDNGSIGNYWDDYGVLGGYDKDDDGIGDIIYNITGSSGLSDDYPIWNDGPDIPPSIIVNSLINNTYSNTPPTINLTYYTDYADTLWYDFDGTNYTIGNNTAQQLNGGIWANIPQGLYYVYLYANDTNGNLNNTFVLHLFKDTQAPQISINTPTNESYSSTPPFLNITFYDPNFNMSWFEFQGINYTISNNTAVQLEITDWGGMAEGVYNVFLYANDSYGYLNDTLTLTLYKDLSTPNVVINSFDNNSYHNTAPFINVSFSDSNYDSLWYEISGVPYALPNYTNHQINAGAWGSLPQGQFTIYIFANDTGGNLNNTFRFIFYKDTSAPAMDVNYPADGSHFTSAPIINIWVGDPNIDSMWFVFEGGIYDFSSNLDKQIDSGVWAGLAPGVYYVYIYANDTFGYLTTASVLTIYKDAGITTESPPFDPLLLIILLVIIGIIAIVAIGFLRTRAKKEPKGLEIKAKRKTTSEYKRTTTKAAPIKPKVKKSPSAEVSQSPEEMAAISEETQKTRAEMLIEEKEDICPVHKGPIVGIMYACPKCKTKYCMKCARTLVQNNEGCWACNDPISFFDEDLNGT